MGRNSKRKGQFHGTRSVSSHRVQVEAEYVSFQERGNQEKKNGVCTFEKYW